MLFPIRGPTNKFERQGLIDPLFLSGLFGHTWPNGGGFIKFPLFRLDHIFMDPVLRDVVEIQKIYINPQFLIIWDLG